MSYELNCYIAKWLGHFGGLLTVSRGLFSYELRAMSEIAMSYFIQNPVSRILSFVICALKGKGSYLTLSTTSPNPLSAYRLNCSAMNFFLEIM